MSANCEFNDETSIPDRICRFTEDCSCVCCCKQRCQEEGEEEWTPPEDTLKDNICRFTAYCTCAVCTTQRRREEEACDYCDAPASEGCTCHDDYYSGDEGGGYGYDRSASEECATMTCARGCGQRVDGSNEGWGAGCCASRRCAQGGYDSDD